MSLGWSGHRSASTAQMCATTHPGRNTRICAVEVPTAATHGRTDLGFVNNPAHGCVRQGSACTTADGNPGATYCCVRTTGGPAQPPSSVPQPEYPAYTPPGYTPPNGGATKPGAGTSPPAETPRTGAPGTSPPSEEDSFFRANNPIMWLLIVGGFVLAGGIAYVLAASGGDDDLERIRYEMMLREGSTT